MKKVSIIVPVYNVEKYLSKCIDSLLEQTFKDIEIILVNDGSTDNSYSICKEYADNYKDKVVLISKENEGQAIARNIAIDKAQGEYLMFVDSDDWINNNMVDKMYNKAISTGSDIVWCLMMYVNNLEVQQTLNIDNDDDKKKYILNNAGPCQKLIKKSIIVDNNLYFPKIRAYEDIAIVPFWCIYANKITYIDEGLYYYFMHTGSTMKQVKYNKKLEDIFTSLEYLYNHFQQSAQLHLYKDELEWIFIEHLLHAASLRFFSFDNFVSNINKIRSIMMDKFPNWNKNRYYKVQGFKYKIICQLFYRGNYKLLKIILKK